MELTIKGEELAVSVSIGSIDNDAPDRAGVYGFFLCSECVYVGQSKNLRRRLRRHLNRFVNIDNLKDRNTNNKYRFLKPYIKYLDWSVIEYVDDASNLTITERYWIDYYNPIFNVSRFTGNKLFQGTIDDIDDFVCGLQTMDDLRKLLH